MLMILMLIAIINLACPASPINYQKDPIQTFKTNIFGSINALNLAKERNIPVIQASTSKFMTLNILNQKLLRER